jgi:hypothetical protein
MLPSRGHPPPGRDLAEGKEVSDPNAGTGWPPPENDEYDPALPIPTNRLLRPRRAFGAPIILVIVFGITASLAAIGISRLEKIEPTPAEKEVPTSLNQPDRSSVEPVEPPKPPESLVLDATRSYLASGNPNAKTATDDERLQLCLFIEDGYKERLDCYDGIFTPDPKPKPPVAKLVADCRFLREEDERLACFNRFLAPSKPPKAAQKAIPKAHPSK